MTTTGITSTQCDSRGTTSLQYDNYWYYKYKLGQALVLQAYSMITTGITSTGIQAYSMTTTGITSTQCDNHRYYKLTV
jgi:hypothetical protein